jgi:hypothetical protein
MTRQEAFKLLDEYLSGTTETRGEAIVTQLYKAGYVIRPDNQGSWGLYHQTTRALVTRPEQKKAGGGSRSRR